MRRWIVCFLSTWLLPSPVLAETAVKRELVGIPFTRMPKYTERFFPRTAQEQATIYAGGSYDFSGVGRAVQGNFQNISDMCSTWGTRISGSLALTIGHHVPTGSGDRLLFVRDDHNGANGFPEIPAVVEFLIRQNGISSTNIPDFALMRLDGVPWSTTAMHASYPIYVHDFGSHPSNNLGENPNAREVIFVGIGSDGTQPPGGTSCRDPYHQKVAKTRLVRSGERSRTQCD